MALTLATAYFSSIALLFRCFSKERLIWSFFNHMWFFWIPLWLNCSLQKHNAFLFQCFSVFLSCTFKNIGDILKFAERFIMMTSFHPNYLFFPTCIILPVTTTWLILWHDKLDVGKNKYTSLKETQGTQFCARSTRTCKTQEKQSKSQNSAQPKHK